MRNRSSRLDRLADWVTISSLATAGGTLVLAGATFARGPLGEPLGPCRRARAAWRGCARCCMPSRLDDPPQKVLFVDGRWVRVPGGGAVAEAADGGVYLAMSRTQRRFRASPCCTAGGSTPTSDARDGPAPPLEEFERLTRDLYVPAGDVGFWQGALRDPRAPEFPEAARGHRRARTARGRHPLRRPRGRPARVSRFTLVPSPTAAGSRARGPHWNIVIVTIPGERRLVAACSCDRAGVPMRRPRGRSDRTTSTRETNSTVGRRYRRSRARPDPTAGPASRDTGPASPSWGWAGALAGCRGGP